MQVTNDNITLKHKKRGISKFVLILAIMLTAVVAYVGGMKNDEIVGVIGPVFGIKTETGSINLKSVQETYRKLKANYDGPLDESKLIEGANRGLVEGVGDQYTVFMNSQEASDFDKELSGNIGSGIGAEIGIREDRPYIVRVMPDKPADKSGLHADDIILTVNDEPTIAWTAEKTVSKIRGEAGTTVKISILRGTETKDFSITRAPINIPSVSSEIVDGIGIMTISRFDEDSGNEARRVANDFKKAGVKAVVLDLRGNGGGYITAAQVISGIWLDRKLVVTERTNGKVTHELKSGNDAILAGIPTAVIVNGGSASASEIVAGALQDHKVATLIGDKTYGKGTMQDMLKLMNDARLKVTIGHWYTPNGKNINKEGIEPDIKVTLTQADIDANNDTQLEAAKAFVTK